METLLIINLVGLVLLLFKYHQQSAKLKYLNKVSQDNAIALGFLTVGVTTVIADMKARKENISYEEAMQSIMNDNPLFTYTPAEENNSDSEEK